MMNTIDLYVRRLSLLACMCVLALASACSDDDPPLPDNVVSFPSTTSGLGEEENEMTVVLNLTRATSVDVPVHIGLQTTGVTYGVEFYTEPGAVDGTLNLTIPQGGSSVSFKLVKKDGLFFQGTESVSFAVVEAGDLVVDPTNGKTVIKFSAIVSEGATLILNGLISNEAGSAAGNSVFVDLSNNQQTPVNRKSWDLGFYNGGDFRVIINNTAGASVLPVDKTDLTTVTSADVDLNAFAVGGAAGTFDLFDDVYGDLDKTAIPEIQASAGLVYVINLAGGSGLPAKAEDLVKVRISRKGTDGYTVQYAKIDESAVKSADILKDAAYNFSYFSFANGATPVEPAKAKWDIEWTWSLYHTLFDGSEVPYAFSDLVFINHLSGTQAAEVMITDAITYDGFGESDLGSITWSGDRNTFGSNWRITQGTPVGVKKDRFYLVKDSSGNVYKLSFISFHPAEGGVRGKPQFKYALVKKGA